MYKEFEGLKTLEILGARICVTLQDWTENSWIGKEILSSQRVTSRF